METPDQDFLAPHDLHFLNTLDLDCSSELLSTTSDHEEHALNEKCYADTVIPTSVVIQQIAPDLDHGRFLKYLTALRASGIEEVRWHGGGAIHPFPTAEVDFTEEKDAANFVQSVQGVRLRPFDEAGISVDFLTESTRSDQRNALSARWEGKSNAASCVTKPADESASTCPVLSGVSPCNDYGFDRLASSKRKREPRVIHGYPCEHDSCDRVFDRAGDRNKHRRSHASKKTARSNVPQRIATAPFCTPKT